MLWWVGRRGGGGAFGYLDSEGRMLGEMRMAALKNEKTSDAGFVLLAMGTVMQAIAIFL